MNKASNTAVQLLQRPWACSARSLCLALLLSGFLSGSFLQTLIASAADQKPLSFAKVIESVQPKMVKIYGAGGLQKLEAYQSGFLISSEGHILTVWSYVLDSDTVDITLDDGRKFTAQVMGADPRLEIAILKIEAENLPYFSLPAAAEANAGTRILAFSNLFGIATGDEPASVLKGLVSAVTNLSARSGVFETPYRGEVLILDAVTNNPGAAGGALTNVQGELLGMLGKELRNSLNNTWLNYALPIEVLAPSVEDILAGKVLPRRTDEQRKPERSLELTSLGIVLVPDVLDRTPPFIERIKTDSPAAKAGLQPDDLIVFLNDRLTQSCKLLSAELAYVEFDARVKLTVMRGQELVEVLLEASNQNR